jgi:hypothetical protein
MLLWKKSFSFHEGLELYRKCIPEFVDDLMKFRQLDSIFKVDPKVKTIFCRQ